MGLLIGLLALPAGAVGACPNEPLRTGASATLPACMAYELVSPPRKASQGARLPMIGLGGDRVAFESAAGLGDTPGLNGPGDIYVGVRGEGGWVTRPTAPPVEYLYGYGSYGLPSDFTPDLGRWSSTLSTQAEGPLGIFTAFQGTLEGPWTPWSPRLVPVAGTVGRGTVDSTRFQGSSSDLGHVVFSPGAHQAQLTAAYLPGDPSPAPAGTAAANAYVATRGLNGPQVELLARDAAGVVFGANCGAEVGGSGVPQGSISAQGRRIYFATRPAQPPTGNCSAANPLRILQRLESPGGPQITEPIDAECALLSPALPCGPAVPGDDLFQAASLDGGMLFFTTSRKLAASDLDAGGVGCYRGGATLSSPGCDLYLYDSTRPAGERLVQASVGGPGDPSPGEGAEVLGVTAVSGDGSRAYFVARGLLTGANLEAVEPAPGQPNLYLYERNAEHPSGRTAFVGTLAADCQQNAGSKDCSQLFEYLRNRDAMAVPLLGPDLGQPEVGGDGRFLAFGTQAALVAEDADGARRDDYRYDAVLETLRCLTCTTDAGPFEVEPHRRTRAAGSVGAIYAQQGRWVTEDASRVVFETAEALTPADRDGQTSIYLWDEGELTAISGTNGTISQDGGQVAFETFAPLVGADGDTGKDIYVAREGGGTPEPVSPEPCEGASCQGPPAPGQASTPPATQTLVGPGNAPVPRAAKRARAKKAKNGKHRGKRVRSGRRHGTRPAGKSGGRRTPHLSPRSSERSR